MIQHLTIKVYIDIFQNTFAMISFILYNILVNTGNPGTIVVIIIFEFFSFIGGVSVCYNGMFKKSDIFYISLAGPVMPLFYSFLLGLILFIVNLVTSIDTILLIKFFYK